jgi:hypothetical protein
MRALNNHDTLVSTFRATANNALLPSLALTIGADLVQIHMLFLPVTLLFPYSTRIIRKKFRRNRQIPLRAPIGQIRASRHGRQEHSIPPV